MRTSLAIMQPYFFPYVGYFQLLHAADMFVFYDDVHFIKNGWINRNRILANGEPQWLTVPCRGASPNKLIMDVEHMLDQRQRRRLLNSIRCAYGGAPFFDVVYPLVEAVLRFECRQISELAIESVERCARYLGIETSLYTSSESYPVRELRGADRLIDICSQAGAGSYLNAPGGRELYGRTYFRQRGVDLAFVESARITYPQGRGEFVPNLSIIDVIMFNDPVRIRMDFLSAYTLS